MADPSPPPPATLSVIETCWSTIEVYLDLEAAVSLSQTCRALNKLIVDVDSDKLKLTHFEVDNTPTPSPRDVVVARRWQNAPARIPHYLSRSLNAIHFPALRRLYVDFPSTKRRDASGHADIIDDAHSTSFPILVSNLSTARNLKHLHLNVGRLMANERSGQLESLYEIFGSSLMKCRKLRNLDICNDGAIRGLDHSVYSIALLKALTPAIRKLQLERLKLVISGTPSDPTYHRMLCTKGVWPTQDLFEAVMSSDTLTSLELSLSHSYQHLNALLSTAIKLSSNSMTKPHLIKHLKLSCEESAMEHNHPFELQLQSDVAPLLQLFSECNCLESIFLDIPRQCWDGENNVKALRQLLENKPSLSTVTISFSNVNNMGGKIPGVIPDCLAQNISDHTFQKLCIFGLRGVDEEFLSNLQLSLRASGMICNRFRANRTYSNGVLDIMIMSNVRIASEVDIADAYEEFILSERMNMK